MPGVSLNPAHFASGSFLEEGEYEFRDAKFCVWDYDGKGNPTLAFHAVLVGSDGGEHKQYWSAGDPARFAPSKDGERPAEDNEGPYVCPLGQSTDLNKGTNFGVFMVEAVNAGLTQTAIEAAEGDVGKVFSGMRAYVVLKNQPTRTGLAQAPRLDAQGNARIPQIPVISRVIAMPGEKVETGKANGTSGAAVPAAAAEVVNLAEEAINFLMEQLGGTGKIARGALMTKAFQQFPPDRRAGVLGLLNDPKWLAGTGIVTVGDKELTLNTSA